RSLAYVVVVACTSAATLSIGHAQTRAVIELFTSQGCSSCPAADRLIGELTKDPSLISISVPIDYWDYLGCKATLPDPLPLPPHQRPPVACTQGAGRPGGPPPAGRRQGRVSGPRQPQGRDQPHDREKPPEPRHAFAAADRIDQWRTPHGDIARGQPHAASGG